MSNFSPRDINDTQKEPPSTKPHRRQQLVLIGGGHAHVQVIKALHAAARPNHLDVTLVDAQKEASYSGMVPGAIAQLYTLPDTLLPLKPLAKASQITFCHATVVDLDLQHKIITLQSHDDDHGDVENENENEQSQSLRKLPFDVVSMDIGSTSRDLDSIPGAREYTIPTRPIAQLVQRLEAARQEQVSKQTPFLQSNNSNNNNGGGEDNDRSSSSSPQLVVVGGGAAGIELAMAITTTWQNDGILGQQQPPTLLLDFGSQLLPNESDESRRKLQRILRDKNISVQHNCRVRQVRHQELKVEIVVEENDGFNSNESSTPSTTRTTTIPFTHCVWATGAGAHALPHHLHQVHDLDITDHGWITVQSTLQSTSHPFVFAAGDCASIQLEPVPIINKKDNENTNDNDVVYQRPPPPPKAGVFAVRAGPILIENLTRYLEQQLQQEQEQQLTDMIDTDAGNQNHNGKPEKRSDKNDHLEDGDSSDSAATTTSSSSLISYQPQEDYMKLLVCGNGKAIGFRFGISFYGKWVFDMKDRIDNNFMNLFRVNKNNDKDGETTTTTTTTTKKSKSSKFKYHTAQYDDDDDDDDDDHGHATTGEQVQPSEQQQRLSPRDAAVLLRREDDDVDFLQAWQVLKVMARDDDYRQGVLQEYHRHSNSNNQHQKQEESEAAEQVNRKEQELVLSSS